VHHVRFKEIRPEVVRDVRAIDRSFLDAVIAGDFTVLGDGCIDFQAIENGLKAMDCSGCIVVEVEQDPAKAPLYEYSEKGYAHILEVCDRAGLTVEH
jgi:inosose dehydratase